MYIEMYVLSVLSIISIVLFMIVMDNKKRGKSLSSNFWVNIDRYSENELMKKFMFDESDKICKSFKNVIKTAGIPKLTLIRFQTISILSVICTFFIQLVIWATNVSNILLNKQKLTILAEKMLSPEMASIPKLDLISIVIISLMAYGVPFLFVFIYGMFRSKKAEKEIILLQTYALMMMNTNKNVKYILETLYERSNIYKEPLRECLQNYSIDSYEALQILKKSVLKSEWQSLTNSLEKSLFNDRDMAVKYLKSSRRLEANMRKIYLQRKTKNKELTGAVLLILPLATLCMVCGYPWFLLALKMMGNLDF